MKRAWVTFANVFIMVAMITFVVVYAGIENRNATEMQIEHFENTTDPWASRIPIVAMTADAFSENVTECLNAGMNGHIAKPIDVKLVIKEILRIKEEREK